MALNSLDPRVNRLPITEESLTTMVPKETLDQFETYEAFIQVKDSKPFEHVGPVHAPNEEMAFLFAKEQYSRRGMFCNALCVIKTENIKATVFTDNKQDVYDTITAAASGDETESFELFHLIKRGKQHKYVGNVMARDYEDALATAKALYQTEKPVYNILVAKSEDLMASGEEDVDIWNTLKEKQYREATDYRAQDKIKAFKEAQSTQA